MTDNVKPMRDDQLDYLKKEMKEAGRPCNWKWQLKETAESLYEVVARLDAAETRVKELEQGLKETHDCLDAWEAWEATIILDSKSWQGDYPTLTEEQFDALVPDLQMRRKDAKNNARRLLEGKS